MGFDFGDFAGHARCTVANGVLVVTTHVDESSLVDFGGVEEDTRFAFLNEPEEHQNCVVTDRQLNNYHSDYYLGVAYFQVVSEPS